MCGGHGRGIDHARQFRVLTLHLCRAQRLDVALNTLGQPSPRLGREPPQTAPTKPQFFLHQEAQFFHGFV